MKLKKHLKLWPVALRMNQWSKNALVMAAWFFAFADPSQSTQARGWKPFALAILMSASFCLLSSAFYLLNDLADIRADRKHPIKKNRPIASGRIRAVVAIRASLVLFALALVFPAWVVMHWPERTIAFGTILAYTILQSLYSGILKHVPYLDVAIIATGFVLRAVAGAAVIDARISPWLLACTFTLSLFLALAKRRHEKHVAQAARKNLAGYNPVALDVCMNLSALATFAVYMWYTLSPGTVARFGTKSLAWTGLWVALGLVRYLYLVYAGDDTGRPEKILLSDRLLWLVLILYCVSAVIIV